MSGHGSGVFCPIAHVRRTLLKTRIHLKDRSYPIYLDHVYRRSYHRHCDQLPAVTQTIPTVLKQAKHCFTKNCYTNWLTPAQRYEIYKFLTLASTLQFHNNLFLSMRAKFNSIRQSFARQTF